MLVSCMNFRKKMERYLRVNLLGPGPRLLTKLYTVLRSHKGRETVVQCYDGTSHIRVLHLIRRVSLTLRYWGHILPVPTGC